MNSASFKKRGLDSEADQRELVQDAVAAKLCEPGSYAILSLVVNDDHYGKGIGQGHLFLIVNNGGRMLTVHDGHGAEFDNDIPGWKPYTNVLNMLSERCQLLIFHPELDSWAEEFTCMDEGGCVGLANEQLRRLKTRRPRRTGPKSWHEKKVKL